MQHIEEVKIPIIIICNMMMMNMHFSLLFLFFLVVGELWQALHQGLKGILLGKNMRKQIFEQCMLIMESDIFLRFKNMN